MLTEHELLSRDPKNGHVLGFYTYINKQAIVWDCRICNQESHGRFLLTDWWWQISKIDLKSHAFLANANKDKEYMTSTVNVSRVSDQWHGDVLPMRTGIACWFQAVRWLMVMVLDNVHRMSRRPVRQSHSPPLTFCYCNALIARAAMVQWLSSDRVWSIQIYVHHLVTSFTCN